MNAYEKGSALVVALFVFTLVVVIVTGLLERQAISVRRAMNVFNFSETLLYLEGLETWAGETLRQDLKDNKTDHLGEAWATKNPPIQIEQGEMVEKLIDLQGRFNLNNLVQDGKVNHVQLEIFKRLLSNLDIEPELAYPVVDWIDENQEPYFVTGAEDNDYLTLTPPYRTGDIFFGSVSELRLIKGFTEEHVKKIAPHVSVLPKSTTINVNTATIPVLMSLAKLQEAGAEQLVASRGSSGYPNPDAFVEEVKKKGIVFTNEEKKQIAVDSHFFLLTAKGNIGRGIATLNSVIERDNEQYRVISRILES